MDTESAIGIFKNHFIAIRSGTDQSFPRKGWSHLIQQAVITLNVLQPSGINPLISAYTQVHRIFDFNCTTFAPAGCKVIIHDSIDKQLLYTYHVSWGFYIGLAMKYFQNYNVLMDATHKIEHQI